MYVSANCVTACSGIDLYMSEGHPASVLSHDHLEPAWEQMLGVWFYFRSRTRAIQRYGCANTILFIFFFYNYVTSTTEYSKSSNFILSFTSLEYNRKRFIGFADVPKRPLLMECLCIAWQGVSLCSCLTLLLLFCLFVYSFMFVCLLFWRVWCTLCTVYIPQHKHKHSTVERNTLAYKASSKLDFLER